MPPALSDDESDYPVASDIPTGRADDDVVEVPLRKDVTGKTNGVDEDEDMEDRKSANGAADDDEEDDEDGEEDGDVFVVEKILDHMVDEGDNIKFMVKWEGYEKKSDQTWEPEDNLAETAAEALAEYLARIGGREKIFETSGKAGKTKKRGRPSTGTPSTTASKRRRNGDNPQDSTPDPSLAGVRWQPPPGSWEDHIQTLDACEDETEGKLIIYLTWKNGQKSKHDTSVIYKRCPQKMLEFYERHVRIIRSDDKAEDVKDETEPAAG